jgi:cytochrome P450
VDAANTERLLAEYDPFAEETAPAKWDILDEARARCPIPRVYPRTDPGVNYRMITRYEDVRFVLEHPEIFSSTGSAISEINVRLPPLDADPPEQPDFRKILNPLMSRSALLRFEPAMRRIARETIDGFIDDGECEFISQFAVPFSAGVLSRVIFDEDDAGKIAETVGVVSKCATDPSPESFFQLAMCAAGYIAKREATPGDADDILTALAGGTVTGRAMTQEEHLGVVTVLFLAGLDTTRGALGNIAAHLARDPSLEARLRDPKWIRRDMDEFLRFESPVAIMGRTVLREVEVGGTRFVPGDRIIVNFGSANRDDKQFPNGDRLDFDQPRSGNMAFGLGIHRCLGSNLARLQLEFGYHELLSRVTNLRLLDGHTVHYETGMVHGPAALPLRFDKVE